MSSLTYLFIVAILVALVWADKKRRKVTNTKSVQKVADTVRSLTPLGVARTVVFSRWIPFSTEILANKSLCFTNTDNPHKSSMPQWWFFATII
jgi:hypothetical protein